MNRNFKWASEEACLRYGYPVGYEKPNPFSEQYDILLKHFPVLHDKMYNRDLEGMVLHQKAEGNFLYFDWRIIDSTYCGALEKLLIEIKKSLGGDLKSYRDGKFNSSYLKQQERTIRSLDIIKEQQKGYEILVTPAQFGFLHKENSSNKTRSLVAHDTGDEFCLGPFEVGIMFLTHPGRLVHNCNLKIICPGGEISVFADGNYSYSPVFYYLGGVVDFSIIDNRFCFSGFGSVTAFIPQE